MGSAAVWTILSIIAVAALILFWGGGQDPVWGSLTLELIGGLIAAGVYAYIGYRFLWAVVGKWCVAVVVVAFAQEVFRGAWKRFRR
jgi:hypothetical protein